MKGTGDPSIDALYMVGKGKVEFVDVPELGFVAIDGDGAPGDDAFSNGRHHEIYLGDPRTSAPEKLRTILRQPIEEAV